MASSKRSNESVPSYETGAASGDFNRSQSIKWQNKGGRNATTESSRRAAGQIAPRPQVSKQPRLGATANTASTQASMARVNPGGKGDSGMRLPVQSPKANQVGTKTSYGGNGNPPAPRGGPSGLRAGGRNQTWPNGALYTNAISKVGNGKDSGPVATRKPARRGKGAAFYGEY